MVASIIITTFNRSELLFERSLKSALRQTYKDKEIIVVDDAGTDGLEERIKQYPEVRYFRLPENKGLSYARNFGIKQSQGKYIVCLDDDNELMPQFLSRTIDKIDGFDAIATGRVIQYKDFAHYVLPKIYKYMSIDWGWLIKKKVFDKIQYDELLRANEDSDFGLLFYKNFMAISLDEPLTIAYDEWGDPKKSLSFPNQRELNGMIRFFNKNYEEYTEPKEKWCLYRLMGRKFYRGGHKVKGIKYFWQGFLAYKTPRALLHATTILFGWWLYDQLMTLEERMAARK